MNETIGKHIYEYDDFSFVLSIPDYWTKIYKGQPRKKLYHDYCVMLDLVKKISGERLIIDVGANNGLFCIPAAMLGYTVKAFEPVTSNFINLGNSYRENNLKTFSAYKFALSNNDSKQEIYIPECLDNASFSAEAAVANMKHSKEYKTEEVICKRFDSMFSADEDDIGLIKIDVQGAEYQVLEGAKEYLTNPRVHDIYIICEYEDHLLKQGHAFEELDELFKSYGFVEQPKMLPNDKLWYKR